MIFYNVGYAQSVSFQNYFRALPETTKSVARPDVADRSHPTVRVMTQAEREAHARRPLTKPYLQGEQRNG